MNVQLTMENLEKNGITACFVQTKDEVIPKLKELIKDGAVVTVGGSTSLFECGVIDFLRQGNYRFLDRYAAGLTSAQIEEVFTAAYTADVYLCSSNAVTQEGQLYNVDGRSNRVSAIASGPKSVIMVVGINKLVKDLDEAIYRVKTVAAPKNCVRLNCATYCKEKGRCQSLDHEGAGMTDGCSGDARICCNYLVSAKQRLAGRIKVILVGEPIGY